MSRVIADRFGVGFRQAERLVRTETSYVCNRAEMLSYEDAGIEEYEFLTAKDSRTCELCAGMNGKQFKVKDAEVGVNMPPLHPWCRCTTVAVVGDMEDDETKALPQNTERDTIPPDTKEAGSADVRYVGKIDREIYKCVTPDITTDEVVMTEERIQHVKKHHPDDFDKYNQYMVSALEDPDYILGDKPYTALILKKVHIGDERFRLVLRLHTSVDNPNYKNSVLTFMATNAKKWEQNVNNKPILYKKEGL